MKRLVSRFLTWLERQVRTLRRKVDGLPELPRGQPMRAQNLIGVYYVCHLCHEHWRITDYNDTEWTHHCSAITITDPAKPGSGRGGPPRLPS